MNANNQQGFSLIEAMVALFVLTIGVLGAAGLQTQGLRSGSIATQRIVVALKTQELMDRILANPGYKQLKYSSDPVTNRMVATETPVSNVEMYNGLTGVNRGCNTGTVCSSTDMAEHDIYTWQTDLNNFLPGAPNYTVVVDANLNISLTVAWSDRQIDQSYTLTSQIQPLVIVQ